MNKKIINNVIKKYTNNIKKYKFNKNSIIYSDDSNTYVAKENKNDITNIYNYLNSRGFNYMPKLLYSNEHGYIYEYEKDINFIEEEKISDIIKTISLLHNKTAYYKATAIDEYKELYDDLNYKINDVFNYYDNILNSIESKVYMSPSEYMLSRNCSSIFSALNFCLNELNNWYEIVKENTKARYVLIHNNLDIDHIVKNNETLLLSWDNSKRDYPIYDFINLYKKNYNKCNFSPMYKEYTSRFPLLNEEKKLLFIMLFIPWKISFDECELQNTIKVSNLCNYLYETDRLFMEQQQENTNVQDHYIKE